MTELTLQFIINLGFFVSTVASQGWWNLFHFNWGGGGRGKGSRGRGWGRGLGACKRKHKGREFVEGSSLKKFRNLFSIIISYLNKIKYHPSKKGDSATLSLQVASSRKHGDIVLISLHFRVSVQISNHFPWSYTGLKGWLTENGCVVAIHSRSGASKWVCLQVGTRDKAQFFSSSWTVFGRLEWYYYNTI